MLEYLRNASEKPIAKVLITILAFSFVGWGVAEWIFGNVLSDTTLVRVGPEKISVQQYNLERSRELATMSRDEMRNVYVDPIAAQKFQNDIIAKLTTQTMVENRGQKMGFIVSDRRIAREIREYPEFQENGQFSTIKFDTVLSNSGYSEAEFANILRSSVLRSMVLGAVGTPIKTPKFAVDAMYNARYATRDIEYATVNFDDFKVGNPTDEDLRNFYATHPQTIAESRTASYVLVPADMSKPDEYSDAYDIAVKVEDAIIGGDSLKDAASANKAKFVSLKPFSAKQLPKDDVLTDAMISKLFTMDEGTESELIETKSGFVIMRLDKITPAHTAEFDSVKKTLANDWVRDAREKQAYMRANEILVDLRAGKQMPNKKSVNVSRASGAPDDVLVAAFKNPVGTSVIVPSSKAFYVMTVKSNAKPKKDEKKSADLEKEVAKISSRNITDDYNSFLIRENPVRVNEKVYRRFLGNNNQ
ncbi:MAG: SurA N-terminal domain-containing protein [Alphaproteobacteria bacterium]|nr:SurA N-terminal domain-containing protein [Alphaproteobacteria bacterium]